MRIRVSAFLSNSISPSNCACSFPTVNQNFLSNLSSLLPLSLSAIVLRLCLCFIWHLQNLLIDLTVLLFHFYLHIYSIDSFAQSFRSIVCNHNSQHLRPAIKVLQLWCHFTEILQKLVSKNLVVVIAEECHDTLDNAPIIDKTQTVCMAGIYKKQLQSTNAHA